MNDSSDTDDVRSSRRGSSQDEEEEFWEENAGGTCATGFSQSELELVYGTNRVVKITDDPQLLKATINMKSFGKSERLASRHSRSLFARLRSIHLDAISFVDRVRLQFPELAVLANLRNGLWYLREQPTGECRFRSSDGHTLSWSFYISRANLPVAKLAVDAGGVMLVDSTRFGKSFPDSFNRSVPLWCAVMNRVMGFDDAVIELPEWVPKQEARRISEDQLNAWTAEVRALLRQNGETLHSSLRFKPFWVANDWHAWGREKGSLEVVMDDISNERFNCIPILCVSASALIDAETQRERFSWTYMPGAADDEENWAGGLTPKLLWDNIDAIMSSESNEECESIVGSILRVANHGLNTPSASTQGSSIKIVIVNPWLTLRWSSDLSHGLIDSRNSYDGTWIKGADKAWGRRNSKAWQSKALPELLARFQVRDSSANFVIDSSDAETACALALALLTVFFEGDEPLKEMRVTVNKNSLRVKEGLIISRVKTDAVSVPRRLFKEVQEFFDDNQWSTKIKLLRSSD